MPLPARPPACLPACLQEIIERDPFPPQSLILLGRSGTGERCVATQPPLLLVLTCPFAPHISCSDLLLPRAGWPITPGACFRRCRQDHVRCVPHV